MHSNEITSWVAFAGIITTANALWVPEKRALTFQNAETSEQNTSTKPHSTTHSEKPTKSSSSPPKSTTSDSSSAPIKSSSIPPSTTTSATTSTTTSTTTSATTSANSTPSASSVTSASSSPVEISSNIISSSIPSAVSSHSSIPTVSSTSSSIATTHESSSSTAAPSSSLAADSATTSSSSGSSAGAIAGGVIGVLVALAIGSVAVLFIRKKRRRELKQSRAARMSTRNDPYSYNFDGNEPKPYSDHQNASSIAQPVFHEAKATHSTYEPALSENLSKDMIEQQQQQYYQSQTSVAAVQPHVNPVPPVIVSPAPQDQSPSLGTFTVIATYIPTLSDELEIEPGDHIELLVEYDDGWCQGVNITRNYAKGVFPRHCIDYAVDYSEKNASSTDVERTKRVSSMYVTGPN